MAQPESVVQDPATGSIYVTNIAGAIMQKDGNGFIARLRPDGTIIEREWVKGLNAPTGMALHDRTLFVADVDELIEINVASGEIAKRHRGKRRDVPQRRRGRRGRHGLRLRHADEHDLAPQGRHASSRGWRTTR